MVYCQAYYNTRYVYVGDNPRKDFLAPNSLGWFTVGIRSSGRNIHPQELDGAPEGQMPDLWIDHFNDLLSVFV